MRVLICSLSTILTNVIHRTVAPVGEAVPPTARKKTLEKPLENHNDGESQIALVFKYCLILSSSI
jgi:hypothetical protein